MSVGGPPRTRVWAEMVSHATLRQPQVLDMLAERGIGLVAAAQPSSSGQLAGLVADCRTAGVRFGLWPMLSDEEGRWAHAGNMRRFAQHTLSVIDQLDGDPPDELAIDLEPPIAWTRAALRGWFRRRRRGDDPGSAALRAMLDRASERGITPLCAVPPFIVADDGRRRGWEQVLGTPFADLGFAHISAMLYTSLAIGYARGVLRRADVRPLLYASARAAALRFGPRASVSLGAVGPGALGDEQCYEGPEELADDVALVRAAGIDDIALFDLGGVLRRAPATAWLDALATPPAAAPPRWTTRARAIAGAAVAFSVVADSW